MVLPAEQQRPDRGEPGDGARDRARADGSARRRTFMTGRRTSDGSSVWFFPESGETVAVPFPGPWTLSLVVRTG